MAPSPRDPRGSSTRAERVSIEGGTLFATVDKADAPNAPSILLSNSLATTHRIWDSQVAFLTRRYRVIRYDTRGHGASGAPPGPYEFEHLVADARAVLDHFGVSQAAFMGISLGGITGIGLALSHPERVERLVCCDARADAPPAFLSAWQTRVEVVRSEGVDSIAAPTLERWLRPAFRASEPGSVARLEEMFRSTPLDGYVSCVAALKRLDYLSHLGELRVPTLYVIGAEDHAISVPVMDDMARKTPGAELVVIEGSAHLPNLDNSAAFNQAIAPFLRLG
jgi:3-oxoadipate enol-lactonase